MVGLLMQNLKNNLFLILVMSGLLMGCAKTTKHNPVCLETATIVYNKYNYIDNYWYYTSEVKCIRYGYIAR